MPSSCGSGCGVTSTCRTSVCVVCCVLCCVLCCVCVCVRACVCVCARTFACPWASQQPSGAPISRPGAGPAQQCARACAHVVRERRVVDVLHVADAVAHAAHDAARRVVARSWLPPLAAAGRRRRRCGGGGRRRAAGRVERGGVDVALVGAVQRQPLVGQERDDAPADDAARIWAEAVAGGRGRADAAAQQLLALLRGARGVCVALSAQRARLTQAAALCARSGSRSTRTAPAPPASTACCAPTAAGASRCRGATCR
jgi:hypothetical protein